MFCTSPQEIPIRLHRIKVSDLRDIVQLVSYMTTVFALIVGGILSYIGFLRSRIVYPCAEIRHKISHRKVRESKLIQVAVSTSNTACLPFRIRMQTQGLKN